ncbi:helix-turn-helix domain-containing protein [Chitinophaga sancti]|uniref:Helix-turn-helix domain-containing protein n=2 Tax=Chitinophaga sancti TaxID=1004 RepID=A0A1K1R5U9_9BACT|nr:helix-turn-helix domain-containing protein [Chitinophaga sancti]WQD64259.1 helix-turn-helix domain-containing protein [Chitinophaga sancti]WQG90117.1 helix-turn-helix domain-containing protein [Chitinophaga sancti]SFW66990.1 Helix-turn-helix domain-containing protein [Chitinophaga sancti]
MLLNNIKPSAPLQSFVRFYRIIDFDFTMDTDDIIQVKAYRPRIEHCLQFTPFDCEKVNYSDGKSISHKVALFGQQTVMSHRKVGKRFLNFQIVFQPGVLSSFLRISMDELSNIYIDAELFFGTHLHNVNEQLALCRNYQEMIGIVELFLTAQLRLRNTALHPVNRIAQYLLTNVSNRKIEWFASQANLSYRQFDRAFKNNTGITPKDFRKLIQLDYAYLQKNRFPDKDWLSIALDSGFYDYQHLSRNYQQFIGHSPTEFYKLEQQAPERRFGDFEQ